MLTFKALLARGGSPPLGTFVKIPTVHVLELLKLAGFDFVVLDGEHAPLSLDQLDVQVAFARAIELLPIVRVPDHGYADVQRVLDAGAAGVLVPHVSDRATAERVIRQMLHPPLGTRGSGGGMRAGGWGLDPDAARDYVDPDSVWRVLMIEEARALEHLDEILAVPYLSAVFVGPSDLSMSMGRTRTDPEVVAAIRSVLEAAKRRGVPAATLAASGADAGRLVAKGWDFVMVSSDTGMLAQAARAQVATARGGDPH